MDIDSEKGRVAFAFSEREDGNMSLVAGDKESVLANRRRFLERHGLKDNPLILINQVHGDGIIFVDNLANITQSPPPEGDAIITSCPNVVVGVMTADCLPIIIFDKTGHGVGAVHAGRKGSALKIVNKTVEMFADMFNVDRGDIVAIIGSGIGDCCYEVGRDMLVPFRDNVYTLSDIVKEKSGGKFMLNLSAVNEIQLVAAGLSVDNIFRLGKCTSCSKKYFSYRGGDISDRMLAIVSISN